MISFLYIQNIVQSWHEKGLHTAKEVKEAERQYQESRSENAAIKRLEAENRQLEQKIRDLQDALIKEMERCRQLMEENAELRQTAQSRKEE